MKQILHAVLLLFASCGKEYHVSADGSDENPRTLKKPFRTIIASATVAQPDDIITVHEGFYRERVNPPRGGVSDKNISRIRVR